MPRGDRTGPLGLGPMTSRAAGYCAGYSVPGYLNPIPGREWWCGFGRGWFGGGRGWRHWFYATGLPGWARAKVGFPAWGGWWTPAQNVSAEDEKEFLKQQAKAIQDELKFIQERIDELEKKSQEEK